MAFLIDQLNNSGLFAQSAYSACIATKDNNGNDITATYLTGVDLTPYQTTAGMTAYATTGDVANKLDTTAFNIPASSNWNSTYDTVQSNSGSWGGGGTIESYNLSAGNYINITKDDVNSAIGIETTGLNVNNWNSNYDTVTANSGAWGGQTLPISAGKGVKVTLVNNNLVFSTDETVLWSGTAFSPPGSTNPMRASATMSESIQNFDQIRLDFRGDNYYFNNSVFLTHPYNTNKACYFNVKKEQSNNSTYIGTLYKWVNDTILSGMCSYGNTQNVTAMSGGYYDYGAVVRVVGINRINNA